MQDKPELMTEEEIREAIDTEERKARHEELIRKSKPEFYDKLGNYVFWLDVLERNKLGGIERSYSNLCRILEWDTALGGIRYNLLSGSFETDRPLPWRTRPGPWREQDDAALIRYVDEKYSHFPIHFYFPAMMNLADQRSWHPVCRYLLDNPNWDGKARVETLLIDYLGAADTPYVRAVTKKTLCAAVMRAFNPGCKFDNILVLSGPQGIGKSTLIARLGMEWFSDSLTVSDMNDKTAAEKLQGYWLLEIGEMAGMKKAELEKVKSFLSRQDDKYRSAYGRRVESHPRQCVFFGTTNEDGYLRDVTGNRRFWTVPVDGTGSRKPWDLDPQTVRQIWLEAAMYAPEEPLYLTDALTRDAEQVQREALEQDDREGLVRAYLESPLPADWERRSLLQRMSWFQTPSSARAGSEGTRRREQVSNMEIWCECFGRPKQELSRRDSAALNAIMARIDGWQRDQQLKYRGPYGLQRVYSRRS